MFFEKNLNLIAARFPYLLKTIQEASAKEDISVEVYRSKSGLPVPRVLRDSCGVYLNSIYDPELEAARWAETFIDETRKCLIIVGGGFLYHLKAILNRGIFKKIVCFEPSVAVLRACLKEVDLTELFDKTNFILISGEDDSENLKRVGLFFGYMIKDCKISVVPGHSQFFNSEVTSFLDKFKKQIRISLVNFATSTVSGERWILNSVANMKHIVRSPGIRHYFDQFTGIPAVIISGGPSLEKNIHFLNEIKEKAVLICAGSSVRAALKNGISPHFLVNIDGNTGNSILYNELNLKDVYLLYTNRSYPDMLDHYLGKKIHMKLDVEQFSDMMTFKSGGYEYGTVRSGFSCAHSALDIAFKFGCNPIILIGQDLAYTKNKRYADGQAAKTQKLVEINHLPSDCLVVKDIYDEDTITDTEFQSFKMWFEQIIENIYKDKANIINATEGGQGIKGVENRKLDEVIKDYCCEYRGISWRIHKIYEKGLKQLAKYGPKALCIPSQVEFLCKEGTEKMGELIDRVQKLQQFNFVSQYTFDQVDCELVQIVKEYENTLHYREYEVLLIDLNATLIPVNRMKILDLGEINSKDKSDEKLQCWLNILCETKTYLEHIRESNQKSLMGDFVNESRVGTI